MTSESVSARTPRGENPLSVTVVVCTRDRPAMLVEAVRALSTATDAEVIVVDSASRTLETRDAAAAAGVGYVRSDVPGLSIARNLGLASATGDVVVFTDDDCTVDPGFVAPLIAPFAERVVGATTGHLRDVSRGDDGPVDPTVALHAVTGGLDAGHGALMAFRRTLLQDLGGFDELLGAGRSFGGAEDIDAFCRVLASEHQVVRVPRAVVTHLFTRDDDDYVRLNDNYGRGIGAMCAKWLRVAPRDGARLTALVLRRAVVRYARRLRSPRTRHGQAAYLRGFWHGLREGRDIPVAGAVFRDDDPPAAIEVSETDDGPPAAIDTPEAVSA